MKNQSLTFFNNFCFRSTCKVYIKKSQFYIITIFFEIKKWILDREYPLKREIILSLVYKYTYYIVLSFDNFHLCCQSIEIAHFKIIL